MLWCCAGRLCWQTEEGRHVCASPVFPAVPGPHLLHYCLFSEPRKQNTTSPSEAQGLQTQCRCSTQTQVPLWHFLWLNGKREHQSRGTHRVTTSTGKQHLGVLGMNIPWTSPFTLTPALTFRPECQADNSSERIDPVLHCQCLWPRIHLRLLRKKSTFCRLKSATLDLVFAMFNATEHLWLCWEWCP